MPREHSSKQYDLDLEQIRSKVLLMGGLVESQFNDALECFRTGGPAVPDVRLRFSTIPAAARYGCRAPREASSVLTS